MFKTVIFVDVTRGSEPWSACQSNPPLTTNPRYVPRPPRYRQVNTGHPSSTLLDPVLSSSKYYNTFH